MASSIIFIQHRLLTLVVFFLLFFHSVVSFQSQLYAAWNNNNANSGTGCIGILNPSTGSISYQWCIPNMGSQPILAINTLNRTGYVLDSVNQQIFIFNATDMSGSFLTLNLNPPSGAQVNSIVFAEKYVKQGLMATCTNGNNPTPQMVPCIVNTWTGIVSIPWQNIELTNCLLEGLVSYDSNLYIMCFGYTENVENLYVFDVDRGQIINSALLSPQNGYKMSSVLIGYDNVSALLYYYNGAYSSQSYLATIDPISGDVNNISGLNQYWSGHLIACGAVDLVNRIVFFAASGNSGTNMIGNFSMNTPQYGKQIQVYQSFYSMVYG